MKTEQHTNTAKQHEKRYDWLTGYQFQPGQSGNPTGRPKGIKTMKTFAKEYLEQMPDREKLKFLETLSSEVIWKMSEGNPKQDTDITSNGETLQPVLVKFIDGTKNDGDTSGV